MKNENLKLRGTKLYLRYPKIEDFAEFMALYESSKNHFRGLVQPITKRETFDKLLEKANQDEMEFFFICRIEDGAIVGVINLSQIFRFRFQNAYLGYFLGEQFTGKGYMTEAVEIILNYAFKDLKLHRLEANVQPNNTPSINILKRAGFTKEGFSRKYLKIGGRWRDHERWAIIFEDWKKFSLNAETRTK